MRAVRPYECNFAEIVRGGRGTGGLRSVQSWQQRGLRAVDVRETYTLESVVAGVLEFGGVHVVYLRHVFFSLLELFLVCKNREWTEGTWRRLRERRRRGRAVGSGFLSHGPDPNRLDMDEGEMKGRRTKRDSTRLSSTKWVSPRHRLTKRGQRGTATCPRVFSHTFNTVPHQPRRLRLGPCPLRLHLN